LEDTTIEDVLKTVEGLYAQKNYQEALKTLESNQGTISPGIWHYNIGTVFGKLENWPMARYHLLMADGEGFNSQEVFLNKKLVESKLEISKFEKANSASDYFVKGGLEASQGLLTTISLILIISAIVNIWKKSSYKMFSVLLTSVLLVLGLNWWIQSWDKVIVLSTQSIQEGPSVIFPSRDDLPVGVMLIVSNKGEWSKILYPSRFQGWIKNAGLKELK
jgi:hypothetical protein